MMLDSISAERIQAMTSQELRWLENTKKAFYESDTTFQSARAEDECFESICKAVDVAKTLNRSLMDLPFEDTGNRKAFIDFMYLEIPGPEQNGFKLKLKHARKGKVLTYGIGELLYEIRCMIHENENLNEAESPNFHILLRWQNTEKDILAWIEGERVIVSGPLLWNRVRQHLCKFLTYVDSVYNLPKTGRFQCSISVPLGGIRPGEIIAP